MLAALLLLVAAVGLNSARAQVHLTKHNLSNTQFAPSARPSSMTEICVFCHTPFGSDATAATPLWNRTQAPTTSYTTYNSLGTSSLDGATAPVGSVSIACLSCHDGVQALNLMINMPGAATEDDRRSGTRLSPSQVRTLNVTDIGADYKRDHPVGNPYGGGPSATGGGPPAAPATYRNTQMRDSDFSNAQSATLNGQTVWWIDTGAGNDGAREKTDIQLYTRVAAVPPGLPGAPAERPEPFIECASCHDPHSAVNGIFLRIANTNSAICLACHNKK